MPAAFGYIRPGVARGPSGLLEFKTRLNAHALRRAGAFAEGATTRWRFGDGRELKTTFRSPWLTVEFGPARQEIEVTWYLSPIPTIERPSLVCQCGSGRYHLYEVDGTFVCRRCGKLDYSCRHLNRHTPQPARLARLRRKIGASEAPFGGLCHGNGSALRFAG